MKVSFRRTTSGFTLPGSLEIKGNRATNSIRGLIRNCRTNIKSLGNLITKGIYRLVLVFNETLRASLEVSSSNILFVGLLE